MHTHNTSPLEAELRASLGYRIRPSFQISKIIMSITTTTETNQNPSVEANRSL